MKELEDMNNEELLCIILAGIQTLRDNEYANGKANTPFTDTEEAEKRAYEKGLNESWECARKMCYMKPEERLLAFDVSGNHLAILSDLTASKAIEKLKAYEERQKQTEDEIKVGDEITSYTDTNSLVIGIGAWGEWHCITAYGMGFEITKEKQKYWKKTGRHFDAIPEMLKQMNREEDK